MGPLVDKQLKAQESSDRMYLDLEEKRMKMEERMYEREEREKRDQREFQLKLFSIMMGKQVHGRRCRSGWSGFGRCHRKFGR